MSRDINSGLRALRAVAPPPELDAMVKARSRAAFVARSTGAREPRPRRAPASVPEPERWVYAIGVVMYGGRALGIAAQLLWRTVFGH